MPISKARLPTGNKPLTTDDVGQLLRELQDHPLIRNGNFVRVEHNGVDLNADVKHGLGKPFLGAIKLWSTESDPNVVVLSPEQSPDPAKIARFRQATADAMTTLWWVFA